MVNLRFGLTVSVVGLALGLSMACGGDGGSGGAGGSGAAGGLGAVGGGAGVGGAGGGATEVPLVAQALDGMCPAGSKLPGTGVGPGTALVKVTLDDYPEALCNDGTPAIMYVRGAAGAASAGDWVIHLQAGGSCGSWEVCRDRWCSYQTSYDAAKMSSRFAPDGTNDSGIFARKPANAFGDANQVFVYYCSSDGWSGQRNDAVLEAPEGEAPSFRLHFRGHSIVEVVMQALKLGVTSDDGSVTLPSLDDATRVLFTGSSAGSQGMTHNVDWMRAQVPNAQVATMMDAITDPLPEDVDDPTIRDNWVLGLQYRHDNTYVALWQAFLDESCVAAHPGADAHLCSEGGFVRLNHITTPMFVRQDLRDPVMFGYFGSTGATMAQFAAAVRKTMLRVPDIQANAIEKNAIVKAPGVHVSNCGQHIVLMNSPWFGVAAQNNATVETQGGMPVTLHDALGAWIGGANVVAIDTDPSAISVCAATTNDQ